MAKSDAKAGTSEQKIGDLYAAFMDTDRIEANGIGPIKADLAAISAVDSHSAAAAMMGDPNMGVSAPVGGWVNIDSKDIENYIFYITQSGP